MQDNQKLFKVIFWVVTSLSILVIGGMITLFSFNVQITKDDELPLLIMGCIFFIMLIIVILIGMFVNKDAKKLHLNQWMWTLIAVYVPNFMGVIIYVIVRSNEKKKLRCINCGVTVDRDFNICPHCGEPFGKTCSRCGKFIQEEWTVCPYCEEKLN